MMQFAVLSLLTPDELGISFRMRSPHFRRDTTTRGKVAEGLLFPQKRLDTMSSNTRTVG